MALSRQAQAANLFARAAAIHESSARLLRASGHAEPADRVEELAANARDRIEHPAAMARMHALARTLGTQSRLSGLLDQALAGAITLLAADRGTIQLADHDTKALRIAAQRGFGGEFLDHFAVVDGPDAACGRAAATQAQTVIADVALDPGFRAHRAIAALAGFRGVQSTPLIDRCGELRGVLSTHFREPHHPSAHELRLTEIYARLVADAIGAHLGRPEPDRSGAR
jgi:GAF domain-containing protein